MTLRTALIAFLIIGSYDLALAQENLKQALTPGISQIVTYKDLKLQTLLTRYDQQSKAHLRGDVSLMVKDFDTQEIIASFYLNSDETKGSTQLFKNYFLTFDKSNEEFHLIIEEALPGKAFILQHEEGIVDQLEITILDAVHETATDDPSPDAQSFDLIHQTIRLQVGDDQKEVSFYDYEISDTFFIEIGDYRLTPLNVNWQPHRIKMIVHLK